MSVVGNARLWMQFIGRAELEQMRPAERRRFADECRHLAELAEPKKAVPKVLHEATETTGVLAELRSGIRGH